MGIKSSAIVDPTIQAAIDAAIAAIPPGGGLTEAQVLALIAANAAPITHNTQHQNGGADEIDITSLNGKMNYVSRGDMATFDYTILNFGVIAVHTDFSFASIVPVGATAIHLRIDTQNPASDNALFAFRKKGYTGDHNALTTMTQKNGVYHITQGFVDCDANRMTQYWNALASTTVINVVVLGWLI